jgi:DNA-binding NtrC family response regulator
MTSHEILHNSPSGENTLTESHRVLIVDDEPAICFAYRKLLESERFGFDICENVAAALALIQRNQYFAVMSDVRFAGTDNMDGIYFVSVVRKAQPLAKVILVTGYGSYELEKTARELGASHYFEKPVMPSLLLSLLRALHLVADEDEENEYFKKLLLAKTQVPLKLV